MIFFRCINSSTYPGEIRDRDGVRGFPARDHHEGLQPGDVGGDDSVIRELKVTVVALHGTVLVQRRRFLFLFVVYPSRKRRPQLHAQAKIKRNQIAVCET